MKDTLKCAILIIAYNRLESLKRVLQSVRNAYYGDDRIDLIISVDYSGTNDVADYVKKINWKHGQKVLRIFEEKQGLKKHILSCGQFLEDYDCLVVLEDDVIVSPSFYQYMRETVLFYRQDKRIAGISLYSYEYNMNARLPFIPEKTDSDIYFLQYAQSWGQIWMKDSFFDFLHWLKTETFHFSNTTPSFVNSWPDNSSWLKLHIKYCVDNNKYFVYPYESFSTCFSDPGEHVDYKSSLQQVSLYSSEHHRKFNLISLDDATVKYDVFFERIIPESNLLIDLYGTKTGLYSNYRYVLTTNHLNYEISKTYALDLRPHELNYLQNIEGDGIYLYDLEKKIKNKFKYTELVFRFGYYFNQEPQDFRKLIKVIFDFILLKINRKFL